MRVVTSKQMKQIEENSLEYGLTYHRLMENAGCAAAAFIRRTFQVEGLNCLIFCGRGNNGGDGLVVARKLYEYRANVLVVTVEGPPQSEEAVNMHTTAQLLDIPFADFSETPERVLPVIEQADILVDAIYGTGFHGTLGEPARSACRAINSAIGAVVSLDIPSGMSADTGERDKDAVRADFTVAFDSRKPAHILSAALPHCGEVELVEIGIPAAARAGIPLRYGSLTTEEAVSLLPRRNPEAHKGSHGHLLAVCGSSRYRGAAALAATGALRMGAGLVTLAAIEPVCQAAAARLPEIMYLPLPELDGRIDPAGAAPLLEEALEKKSAVVFGCGIGDNETALELLRKVVTTASCPVVVDADGINAAAENIHVLQEAGCPLILTPHPGEMSRILGRSLEAVQRDRTGAAMELARLLNAIVVLKGPGTVIAAPEDGLFVNATGGPGLAKGGSGDVLAGMIGSLLAQGIAPFYAAACGVHLHGLAGDQAASYRSAYGMLPSDLFDELTELLCRHGL